MPARRGVDFRNTPQMRPNPPGTSRRTVVIAKASKRPDVNELADESVQLRRSDRKGPAAPVAKSDGARAAGGKARAIRNNRSDRQSAARRLQSRLPVLDREFSTRRHTRKARRPRSPECEIVESASDLPAAQRFEANRPICDSAENWNQIGRASCRERV